MVLSAVFPGGRANPDAGKEHNRDDGNDEERGSNVHDADSSSLEYQKYRAPFLRPQLAGKLCFGRAL